MLFLFLKEFEKEIAKKKLFSTIFKYINIFCIYFFTSLDICIAHKSAKIAYAHSHWSIITIHIDVSGAVLGTGKMKLNLLKLMEET